MKRKKIYKIIFCLILFFSISFTVYSFNNFMFEKAEIKETKKQLEKIEIKEEKLEKTSTELSLVDKYNRYKGEFNNNDIIGTLTIKGSGIDVILVQTDNNSYYLNHLIDRTYNEMGSVFVDYRTNIESSRQINIYGHNSDFYDLPFKRLEYYLDYEFFSNNQIILIETVNGTKTFEIFSVKVITDDIEHTKVSFSNDEDFSNHIKRLRSNSLYDSNIEVLGSNRILVLQTCLMDSTLGEYLIILGREV